MVNHLLLVTRCLCLLLLCITIINNKVYLSFLSSKLTLSRIIQVSRFINLNKSHRHIIMERSRVSASLSLCRFRLNLLSLVTCRTWMESTLIPFCWLHQLLRIRMGKWVNFRTGIDKTIRGSRNQGRHSSNPLYLNKMTSRGRSTSSMRTKAQLRALTKLKASHLSARTSTNSIIIIRCSILKSMTTGCPHSPSQSRKASRSKSYHPWRYPKSQNQFLWWLSTLKV